MFVILVCLNYNKYMSFNNRIKQITIENVKGLINFQYNPKPYLIPNKPNIFVAPNGFGKSSIATAFKSLLKTKLKLSLLDFREQQEENKPSLSIITSNEHGENEKVYFANDSTNKISEVFDIEVINSPLKAKKKALGGGNSYAVIDIEPLILWNTIPKKAVFEYSISKYRKLISKNSILFKNLKTIFDNKKFICEFKNKVDYNVFKQKKIQKIISDFKTSLSMLESKDIKNFDNININKLKQIEALGDITALIRKYSSDIIDEKDLYIQSVQVIEIFSLIVPVEFNKIYKYYSYVLEKEKFKNIIKDFDNAWLKLCLKEKKGQLIAEFPNPSLISNGQRDILVFIAKLLRAEVKLHNDNSILIIDEIFDYLDEANLVAAQYYICKFIDNFKEKNKKLYVILMTHLDPLVFNSYCFKSHKKHVYFLSKSKRLPNEKIIESLLINREKKAGWFDKNTQDDISKYYLHFHPEEIDFTTQFLGHNLEKIETKQKFLGYIKKHFELYKNTNRTVEYDPLAVCCYIRYNIEEIVYNLISEDLKQTFLDTHKTIEKLDLAVNNSIDIPEKYYLLTLIHNEALHCNENTDNYTRLYSKLENLTIRNLILTTVVNS